MFDKRQEENTILYYPSIEIKDGAWLRNALLYWDKISSVVPGSNFNDGNSIEVEYLWNTGLYKPTYPIEMQDDEELCKEFCEQVKKNLKRKRKYSQNKTVSKVHIDKLRIPNDTMVHIDKTPIRILDYLLDEGIAKENCDGPWIDMNDYDANIYMSILARYLAKACGNIEIGTDIKRSFLNPYVPEKNKKLEKQIYLDIAMQDILPVPSSNVSIEEIIDFKMQYKDSLKCFKRRIDEFQWSLVICKETEEIQWRIRMLQREMERDLQEIEELMSSKGLRRTKKALRTLVPIGLDVGVTMLGLKGIISPTQEIIGNAGANIIAHIFSAEKESQVDKEKAYLFYARQNGMIKSVRERY